MKRTLFMILVAIASMTLFGDVLIWQVNSSTKVNGSDIQLFLVPYPSTEDSWPAARVKLVSHDGTSSTILKIWGEDGSGNPEQWDGDWGVEIGDNGSGYWGTGHIQSSTGHNTLSPIQDEMIGISPTYSDDVLEALFIMELGYNEWSDAAEDYVWKTLAQSNPEKYKDLKDYMYAQFDVAPLTAAAWTPDFYTTAPEPNSLLLMLMGLGMLMLKRKQ